MDRKDITNPDNWTNIANLYLGLKHRKLALEASKEALILKPEDLLAWLYILDISRHYNDPDLPIRVVSQLNDIDALIGLAIACVNSRNHSKAEQIYRKVKIIAPNYVKTWNFYGVFCALTNRYEESEKSLLRAIELSPSWQEPYINIGGLYFKMRQDKETEMSYLKAIELVPEYPISYLGLLVFYRKKQRKEDYLSIFDKLTKIAPHYAPVWFELGLFNFEEYERTKSRENLEQAEFDFYKAILHYSGYGDAINMHHKVHELLGKKKTFLGSIPSPKERYYYPSGPPPWIDEKGILKLPNKPEIEMPSLQELLEL
ncbi:MAG: tetratricopeptide repeat protein [Promethearchaeota archaeon]